MLKKAVSFTALSLGLFALPAVAFAEDACLYGKAVWSDGSRVGGSTTISTSWNGEKAYPSNGEYRLCFGGNPASTVTVYVDGDYYSKVRVDGDTRLDITRR